MSSDESPCSSSDYDFSGVSDVDDKTITIYAESEEEKLPKK